MSNHALAALLAHPAIWRGDDCAPEPAALPSGFAALDAALPGRGWPQGALTEMLLEREGIGELRLTLPAPRARAGGRTRRRVDRAAASSLRAGARGSGARSRALLRRPLPRRRRTRCGPTSRRCVRPNAARRSRGSTRTTSACCAGLQVAAREGRTWGVLWRRPGQRGRRHGGAAAARPRRRGRREQARGARAEAPRRRTAATGDDRCSRCRLLCGPASAGRWQRRAGARRPRTDTRIPCPADSRITSPRWRTTTRGRTTGC